MYLYKVFIRHYSPKDSVDAIVCYLIAERDVQIYNYIDRELTSNSWTDRDNDEDGYVVDWGAEDLVSESYKDRMLRLKGDMFDEDAEVTDRFYGVTQYGWGKVSNTIKDSDIRRLKELGIVREVLN